MRAIWKTKLILKKYKATSVVWGGGILVSTFLQLVANKKHRVISVYSGNRVQRMQLTFDMRKYYIGDFLFTRKLSVERRTKKKQKIGKRKK